MVLRVAWDVATAKRRRSRMRPMPPFAHYGHRVKGANVHRTKVVMRDSGGKLGEVIPVDPCPAL
jgi:hypothetical protein